jgi:5-(carboxyamino)imidazole ribonucleotide mutase
VATTEIRPRTEPTETGIFYLSEWMAMNQKRAKETNKVNKHHTPNKGPLVGIIMGSKSDWETMEHSAKTLEELDVPHEVRILSAHRTPDHLFEYASTAEERGLEVIIAAAGGAAHLAGVTAAKTILPVLGVPMESASLKGLDSLLSTVQMPGGIPVGTLAIGKPGAINAALFATAILGTKHHQFREAIRKYRAAQAEKVFAASDLGRGASTSAKASKS